MAANGRDSRRECLQMRHFNKLLWDRSRWRRGTDKHLLGGACSQSGTFQTTRMLRTWEDLSKEIYKVKCSL